MLMDCVIHDIYNDMFCKLVYIIVTLIQVTLKSDATSDAFLHIRLSNCYIFLIIIDIFSMLYAIITVGNV